MSSYKKDGARKRQDDNGSKIFSLSPKNQRQNRACGKRHEGQPGGNRSAENEAPVRSKKWDMDRV